MYSTIDSATMPQEILEARLCSSTVDPTPTATAGMTFICARVLVQYLRYVTVTHTVLYCTVAV